MPTYTELMGGFQFGPWTVMPERSLIRDGDQEHKLEPLVMDVFVFLASHGGEVVSKDQLIAGVWDGRPQTDDVITRCISALRRGLGDDAKSPSFIETIHGRGYRVMTPVTITESPAPSENVRTFFPGLRRVLLILTLATVVAVVWNLLPSPKSPAADAAITSVAVFPFDCMQDPLSATSHLCFGFAEEAISGLKRIESLTVVRKRRPYSERLRIDENSIVTGSVQIIANQVKVAAQIENSRTGVIIWSDTFEADKNSIFELQQQIANGLRRAIDDDFTDTATVQEVPRSYAAAEAYSLGRYLFEKRDHQTIVEAVAQFEKATRLDPTFGPAWLGLAYTYVIWPDYDLDVDRDSTYEKALAVVAEGIEADPDIQDAAGTVYGFVHFKRNEWIAAAEAFESALQAPNVQPIAHHWFSFVMASVGRLDDALGYARSALALDPESPDQAVMISRLAIAYFWINDMENAARYFEMANKMDLQASIHSLAYSLYLIRTGDIDGAQAYATAGLEQNSLDSSWVGPVLDGLRENGDRARSIRAIDQLSGMAVLPANVEMILWVLFDEPGRAMDVARGIEQQGGLFELEIIFIDEFKAFRQHPGFPGFVKAIGLTQYWSNVGCSWLNDQLDCQESF